MHISISEKTLKSLICKQVDNFFTLENDERKSLLQSLPKALARCDENFSQNTNKYYSDVKGNTLFNPYHSVQYTIFLYFLSSEVASTGNTELADKLYYLNRAMNGLDLYYKIELPTIFFSDHPLASVLGRAKYGCYFCFQQGCTVGNNHGQYPIIGDYVRMFANSSIIGECRIGNNVFIASGSMVKDIDVPSNTIVFGQSPQLTFKQMPEEYFLKSSPFKIHSKS